MGGRQGSRPRSARTQFALASLRPPPAELVPWPPWPPWPATRSRSRQSSRPRRRESSGVAAGRCCARQRDKLVALFGRERAAAQRQLSSTSCSPSRIGSVVQAVSRRLQLGQGPERSVDRGDRHSSAAMGAHDLAAPSLEYTIHAYEDRKGGESVDDALVNLGCRRSTVQFCVAKWTAYRAHTRTTLPSVVKTGPGEPCAGRHGFVLAFGRHVRRTSCGAEMGFQPVMSPQNTYSGSPCIRTALHLTSPPPAPGSQRGGVHGHRSATPSE